MGKVDTVDRWTGGTSGDETGTYPESYELLFVVLKHCRPDVFPIFQTRHSDIERDVKDEP